MKFFLHASLFFLTLTVCMQLSAQLPTPVGLPQTMSGDNSDVYIDVNGDGDGDFSVRYRSGDGATWCVILDPHAPHSPSPLLATPSVEHNKVLYEPEVSGWYTTILSQGDMVSSAGNWATEALFFEKNNSVPPPPQPVSPPLASNFTDGALQGFIGIHYYIPPAPGITGGMYYGWLTVEIDPEGDWVTIGLGGSGSEPGQFIQAGSGGSAVPFPIIASIISFGLIGGGIYLKRRNKK